MQNKLKEEIYPYLLPKIVDELEKIFLHNKQELVNLTEIRLRVGRQCICRFVDKECFLPVIIENMDIENILEKLSNYSMYSIQNEINDGYITIKGGHRVGIAGTCVITDNNITNVKNVSSINFRIAKQIIGCSDRIYSKIYIDGFKNTLIVSLPNVGKTTNVRDLTRRLSYEGYTISVIDERSEIACMYNKVPQMDVGPRTDVINKCPKHIGIKMAMRSLAPDIIVVDEIGNKKDIEQIQEAILTGIKILVTAHGNNVEELKKGDIGTLINRGIFDYIVILKNKLEFEIWKCEENVYI